jgi:hypothetical protein
VEYALLVNVPPSWEELPDNERAAFYREYEALREEKGYLGGAELAPGREAITVRVRNGEMLTTDGPFADTKEVFGGYYLFEADDLATVLTLAARIPAARIGGSVEVRPIRHRS